MLVVWSFIVTLLAQNFARQPGLPLLGIRTARKHHGAPPLELLVI